MERNRTRLIWLGIFVVVAALGGLVYLNVTTPAYACGTEWVAPPTAAPAPGATQRLGYVQGDMGRNHVPVGSSVKYLYCPPASGNHYFATGLGPIQPRVYGPNDKAVPEGWVHNLEHGALVVVYNCKLGDGCTDAEQQAFQTFYQNFPNSPVCDKPPGFIGPVIARFDDMAYPYAALVWNQILPLQTFDQAEILAFFQQQGERTNPEAQCASASPGPSGSPAASPAPAAS
jgi:hypothetical protein